MDEQQVFANLQAQPQPEGHRRIGEISVQTRKDLKLRFLVTSEASTRPRNRASSRNSTMRRRRSRWWAKSWLMASTSPWRACSSKASSS